MTELRQDLERRLQDLPDLRIGPWKDTDLICVFFKGRDFAHFHGSDVLDVRLSPKMIREEQLPPSVSARFHPDRSPNSRWICVEFKSKADVLRLVHLVRRACTELM